MAHRVYKISKGRLNEGTHFGQSNAGRSPPPPLATCLQSSSHKYSWISSLLTSRMSSNGLMRHEIKRLKTKCKHMEINITHGNKYYTVTGKYEVEHCIILLTNFQKSKDNVFDISQVICPTECPKI